MIIATAGHVDHGKTSLVKALTGQETDRTAEEQRRGMSIELGYAYWSSGSGTSIDLVDVPGHARFMRTLIAGVGCVDAAILVVAADEGIMPQTVEHVRLLSLLGVRQVVPVITRSTKAGSVQQSEVKNAITQLLTDSGFGPTNAHLVDSIDGTGIGELRRVLEDLADDAPSPPTDLLPRFLIDRHFKKPGAGDVVTGTLVQGVLRSGDTLRLSSTGEMVRPRSFQVHHSATDQVSAGQRCAISLGSTGIDGLERGVQLLAPALYQPTQRFDARIELIASRVPRALQLHLHGSITGARIVSLKASDSTQPLYTQCVLDQPVCCRNGDRFVLRDPASQALIGGGTIVDPYAPDKGRHRPERVMTLNALDQSAPEQTLVALLRESLSGVDLQRFALTFHVAVSQLESSLDAIGQQLPLARKGLWATTAARRDDIEQALLEGVSAHHADHPTHRGIAITELARSLQSLAKADAYNYCLRNCLEQKQLNLAGHLLSLPGFVAELDKESSVWLNRLEPYFTACAPRPPIIGELMQGLQIDREELLAGLGSLVKKGLLVFLGRNRYLFPETVDILLQHTREVAQQHSSGLIDTAAFRDRSGIGRNHSVAVLEYFDRVGLTRQTVAGRILANE